MKIVNLLYYSIMRAQDPSIYRKAVRTKDGRLPPPSRCSGTQSCPDASSSLMSGRLLISGRHLILTEYV